LSFIHPYSPPTRKSDKKTQSLNERIVDNGDTVIVIEHNLDVIKSADWVIDLGPEGGDEGGTVVAEGTPEQVARVKESWTGQYLAKALEWTKNHQNKE
jgi:excinuclease ABC subunit A